MALLRIFAAFIFWQHGAQKLLGMFGGEPAQAFTLLWFAGVAEFLGSIAIAIGFLTRPFALILAADMAVLYFVRYLPQGFPPIVNRDGEVAALLLVISALLVFTGPEKFSVESIVKRQRQSVDSRSIADDLHNYYPAALMVLRVVVGLLFLQHGLQKLFGMIGASPEEFPELRWFAGVLEFFGGPAIALGLFTRFVAFILCGEMAFAYFINHNPRSFWPIQNLGEWTVLYCYTYLFFVSAGPGMWSLDGSLWSKAARSEKPRPQTISANGRKRKA